VQFGKQFRLLFCLKINYSLTSSKRVIVVVYGRISLTSAHTSYTEQHNAVALEEVRKEADGQHEISTLLYAVATI